MSDFKITGPGFYKTRGGERAEVVGRASLLIEGGAVWVGAAGCGVASWRSNGRWHQSDYSFHDLIAPWTEPKKGAVWVNVYADYNGNRTLYVAHKDKESADEGARYRSTLSLLACVSVNWTEGEGL